MEKVVRVDVQVLGDRNFPLAMPIKLPEAAVSDLPLLLDAAQRLNPAATYADVVRAIWRYGTRNARNTLASGVPLRSADLPELVKPVVRKL